MISITIHVDAPASQAIGVKEAIATDLEQYGDVRVVEVRDVPLNQLRMEMP